ncbi:pilus assembly protein PilX [Acinetobacter haemolyticus]|uniref:pilus assembly protein PilX n=1 Tax=Acinetobacter haemolyticus TaxID=29430 RepID=UPI000F75AEBD|nr:pilus assembly protein PilX [Acinetobacter haemolyticus]
MKKNQVGATLVVVLIFLVAITIIGTIAIRQSVVGLKIATNSQVQQLQLQNSDASFFTTELPQNLREGFSGIGMFGFIEQPQDREKELVFCYRADNTKFFDLRRASLMQWRDGQVEPTENVLGVDGYCDVESTDTSSNWFTSGRRVVMTQVAVKFSANNAGMPFADRVSGVDNETSKIENAKPVKVFAVSLMPSLSRASAAQINTCLRQRMNERTVPEGTTAGSSDKAQQDVTTCLAALNVPFKTYVSEYSLVQELG